MSSPPTETQPSGDPSTLEASPVMHDDNSPRSQHSPMANIVVRSPDLSSASGSVPRYPGPAQPHTPPLVFTTQFASNIPHLQFELSSPGLEPLQVGNYSSVVGCFNSSTSNTEHNSRGGTSVSMQVEDSPIKVTCRTRNGTTSPYLAPSLNGAVSSDMRMDLNASNGHPYGYSYSGKTSPIQASAVQPTCSPTQPLPQSVFLGGPMDEDNSSDPHPANPKHVSWLPPASGAPMEGVTGVMPQMKRSTSSTDLPELPAGTVHRALMGRCRFIAFPTNLTGTGSGSSACGSAATNVKRSASNSSLHALESSSGGGGMDSSNGNNASALALFIGQVRFETTPAELIWLVHRTSGACASHLESRGAGCYLLFCKSAADLQLVRGLHKRILFDVGGVWLARTAEEVDALCEYVALDAAALARKARLPRDSMVVEEMKVENNNASHRIRGVMNGHRMQNTPQGYPGMMPVQSPAPMTQQQQLYYNNIPPGFVFSMPTSGGPPGYQQPMYGAQTIVSNSGQVMPTQYGDQVLQTGSAGYAPTFPPQQHLMYQQTQLQAVQLPPPYPPQ